MQIINYNQKAGTITIERTCRQSPYYMPYELDIFKNNNIQVNYNPQTQMLKFIFQVRNTPFTREITDLIFKREF